MTEHDAQPISVDVRTVFLESQSDPSSQIYIFAYTINIRNNGTVAAKLLSRHWVIRDANGKVQEVQGEGVVGEQPYLQPGEQFEYTSGTQLETSMGTMGGSYLMRTDDGSEFKAPVDEFLLSGPRTLH